MTEQQPHFEIAHPPKEAMMYQPEQVQERPATHVMKAQGEQLRIIERIEYPEEGGMYVYHKGAPYPMRGFPYPEAVMAAEFPKRWLRSVLRLITCKAMIVPLLVLGVTPKKWRAEVINRFCGLFSFVSDAAMIQHYLQPDRYTNICRELKPFVTLFLMEMGVPLASASNAAIAFTTLIEYDTAYRLPLEDILTETTKEKLIANPGKEAYRLVGILAKRMKKEHLVGKFRMFAYLLRYGAFVFNKPFRKAMKEVDFAKMQLDDIDRFAVSRMIGYDYGGKTVDERKLEFEDLKIPVVIPQ